MHSLAGRCRLRGLEDLRRSSAKRSSSCLISSAGEDMAYTCAFESTQTPEHPKRGGREGGGRGRRDGDLSKTMGKTRRGEIKLLL